MYYKLSKFILQLNLLDIVPHILTFIMKQKLRDITTDQVDEMIMIKWGKPVTNSNHTAFVSNSIIGKIYGIDGSSVRRLYLSRF